MSKKSLMMIQPGAVGDIIICLPIAKFYSNEYDIIWPVRRQFMKHFYHIDYVTPVLLDDEVLHEDWLRSDVMKCYKYIVNHPVDSVLDLADRGDSQRQKPNENFEQYKYREAGVHFTQKHSLEWERDTSRENYVYERFVPEEHRDDYAFVHDSSSHGEESKLPDDIDTHIVRCEDFSDKFNIFDWYKVIKNAKEIYVTESSVWAFCDGLMRHHPAVISVFNYLLPRSNMGNMTTISAEWSRRYING